MSDLADRLEVCRCLPREVVRFDEAGLITSQVLGRNRLVYANPGRWATPTLIALLLSLGRLRFDQWSQRREPGCADGAGCRGAGVSIVGTSVQPAQSGKVIRVHPIRHDRARELGAFANPKGRRRRKDRTS